MARKMVGAITTGTVDITDKYYVDNAIANANGYYTYISAQSGTTFTVTSAHLGALVTLSNTSPITVTLTDNATQAFAVGARVDFLVINTGMVTFVAGGSATVNATPSAVSRARWSAMTAIKIATNDWVVVGDLA